MKCSSLRCVNIAISPRMVAFRQKGGVECVARSRQVCIYVVEALLIAIYLPKEKTLIYTRDLP